MRGAGVRFGAFASLPFLRSNALPWSTVWDIFLVNLVVKGLVSVASIPLIYLVPERRPPELPEPAEPSARPPVSSSTP